MNDRSFEELIELKSNALSIPWLTQQTTELAKFYLSWIAICRMPITDWDEQIQETTFLDDELDEALEKIDTCICIHNEI
jgi:hypothetical protein